LSPLCVFLQQDFSASSCWSADSHVFSRFVSSSPLLTPHSLPISQFLQTPHFSKSFFLPLLSSPPTRNPLLQESFQQHYFHNTQQKTKQNKTKPKTKTKNKNKEPTTETLDPDDAIHLLSSHTQKKTYQNTQQLPHPTPKNTQTKQNKTTQHKNQTTPNQTNPLKTPKTFTKTTTTTTTTSTITPTLVLGRFSYHHHHHHHHPSSSSSTHS
jgi:hypothetical protein